MWPATRPIALGQGVVDKQASEQRWAEGTPARDASNVVASGTGAGPDLPNLAGWVGAMRADAPNASSNFASGEDPRRAWGEKNQSTSQRIAFAIAWHQAESAWYLDAKARSTSTPANGESRYVDSFAARRYFGATLAFDVSSCAAAKLETLLGGAPVLRRTRAGEDPTAGTMFDPAKRAAVEEILVADGAQPYVSVVSNRPRSDVSETIRTSRCSAADMGACARLLDDLQERSRALAAVPEASTYEDLAANKGEWSVTEFATAKVAFLR
jgi:hypothetical protein